MLLTNVTRSASYETLPNHRPFPAVWINKPVQSEPLPVGRRQRNALDGRQKWGCCGSTELAIVVARRSDANFSRKTQHEKLLNFAVPVSKSLTRRWYWFRLYPVIPDTCH